MPNMLRAAYTPVQDLMHKLRRTDESSEDGTASEQLLEKGLLMAGSPHHKRGFTKTTTGSDGLDMFLRLTQQASCKCRLLQLKNVDFRELSSRFLNLNTTPNKKSAMRCDLEATKKDSSALIGEMATLLKRLESWEKTSRMEANKEVKQNDLPSEIARLKKQLQRSTGETEADAFTYKINEAHKLLDHDDPLRVAGAFQRLPEPYKTIRTALNAVRTNWRREHMSWMQVTNDHDQRARRLVLKQLSLLEGLDDVSMIPKQRIDDFAGQEDRVLAELTALDAKEGVDAEFAKQHYFLARKKEEEANEILELQLEIKSNWEEIQMLIHHDTDQLNDIYHNVELSRAYVDKAIEEFEIVKERTDPWKTCRKRCVWGCIFLTLGTLLILAVKIMTG